MIKEKKGHVGRPSNKELRDRKIKKILMYIIPILIVLVGVTLISSGSLKNLMGNSVTRYVCEDSTYTLNGNKCTKLIKEKANILGDVNKDTIVNTADVMIINASIKNVKALDDLEKLLADVNKDGNIDEMDLQIVNNYAKGINSGTNYIDSNVGVEKVCPKDYTLNKDYCEKTIVINAKIVKEQEQTNDNNAQEVINNKNSNTKETNISFDLNYPSEYSTAYGYIKNMPKVKAGQNTKLNSVKGYSELISPFNKKYLFAGWRIKNSDSNNYYCYTNNLKTTKDYVDESVCKKYDYVLLEDEQEIPDEIFVDNITMVANWITYEDAVYIEPIEEEITNVQNGTVTKNTNLKDRTYFADNTTVTFKISVNKNILKNKYRIVYSDHASINKSYSECRDIPASHEIIEKIPISITTINGNENNDKFGVGIILYSNDNCPINNNTVIYDEKKYDVQFFKVKYDGNGGNVINNQYTSYTTNYYYNSKIRSKISEEISKKVYRNGYDLIGYKVKNSKNKYICYKDSAKTSKAFVDEETCKKNGYVIYKANDKIYRTTSTHKETLTFIAQWTNNPVVVNIGKLGTTNLKKGDVVHIPITFKINDKENTYYYKWGYMKWGYSNTNKSFVSNTKEFIEKFDAFNDIHYYSNGEPYVYSSGVLGSPGGWHLTDSNGCKKVTETEKFVPQLTINKYVNAGIIVVYTDKDCKKILSSEKNVHKITEVFFCKNCNL